MKYLLYRRFVGCDSKRAQATRSAGGQMAITRFLGPGTLEERVGKKFGERPVMVPLPHPSGQSRWLNAPENRKRLEKALALIGELRSNFAA